ncbi:hypothetical protein OH805_00215 [Streptomyces sp. NBC_00879]|uniref:hypothetical protein n=1 Tax=Streptomyces sp. NBC_00879 TaxID=2975855 RepID=UPI00386B9621|nr:hypothetical protein OH805_00215 [Streptomyces sp. NBC_00879]
MQWQPCGDGGGVLGEDLSVQVEDLRLGRTGRRSLYLSVATAIGIVAEILAVAALTIAVARSASRLPLSCERRADLTVAAAIR